MSGVWRGAIAEVVAQGPFVVLATGVDPSLDLRTSGATVVAQVRIGPVASRATTRSAPAVVPTLDLQAPGTELDVQAEGFGRALEDPCNDLAGFFDCHDPHRAARLVTTHSTPTAAAADRECWASGPELARHLETKRSTGALLASTVPWVPGITVPERLDERWWREATSGDACGVVVQRAGLSAGGEATWLCATLDEARAALAACDAVRVSPWLGGLPINVVGVVARGGEVLVLPPSRQLVVPDVTRRPLYCGNAFDWDDPTLCAEVETHARATGRVLAGLGFAGFFGLDGLLTPDGIRYHDLNARINGAVLAVDAHVPVLVGGMLLSGWGTPERIAAAEAEVRAALDAAPIARWRITSTRARSGPLARVPRSGRYRLDPAGPSLSLLEIDDRPTGAGVEGDVVVVRPRAVSGTWADAGARAPLADLLCAPAMADTLVAMHGVEVIDRLADAVQAVGDA